MILLICGSLAGYAQIESRLPETHSNLPILVSISTSSGDATGSGFLLEEKGWWFLVTAKHVLFDRDTIRQTDTLIGHSATLSIPDSDPQDTSMHILLMDLNVIQSDNRILKHRTADIALVTIGTSDSVSARTLAGSHFLHKGKNSIHLRGVQMLSKYSDVKIGNDIYLYGYPTSIGLDSMPQFDYSRPLLRKGIIAGKNDNAQTIILDCPVYYGNSGGPIVQESPIGMGSKFKIVGVVTQWIPFDEARANRRTVRRGMLYTNSGYAVSESSDRILEILAQVEAAANINKNIK